MPAIALAAHRSTFHPQQAPRLPRLCDVCLEPCDQALGICSVCFQQLPVAQQSCSQCAIPYPSFASHTYHRRPSSWRCPQCCKQPPALDYSHCSFLYRPPVNHWLQHYKDRHKPLLAQFLAELMICRPPIHLDTHHNGNNQLMPKVDCLVYLPSHRRKLLWRGFNPAELLARQLSRYYRIPLIHHALRKQPGQDQRSRSGQQRRRSARQLYAANPKQRFDGLHVLLIDDVITTGASANSAAFWLKRQGASIVGCWALARTPKPSTK